MYDKYFEYFEKGEKWKSRGRTITETDLVMFSALTGDYYPLHTDIEFAKQSFFKQRIAHGMLVLSFGVGLTKMEPGIVIANYGIDKLRFIQPVFINDTIHVELEVIDLEDKGNGTGVVTVKQSTVKQTGETCIVGISKALIKKENI
ncbi:MaoC/PaaZ C-terminal domain-containing protein [Neobacillus niacini]|uniref:MaoC/PaaZ C-terminal domain-containing protein n=1 Tax=Neobacillus niacini TaxID=86668 RepID=UPI0021CB1FBC|nr:MaoC/PaaZ C-terminal domain-containing protein [Neobacillus niacini]MCM3764770.1 dehydratase [Neobacillus niacini]